MLLKIPANDDAILYHHRTIKQLIFMTNWTTYEHRDTFHAIDDLAPGQSYQVTAISRFGWRATSGGAQTVSPGVGETAANVNFGYHNTLAPTAGVSTGADLSGRVFEDGNGDGVQQEGEPGLVGWTVFLDLDNDGALGTDEPRMTTSADDESTEGVPGGARRPHAGAAPAEAA